MDFEPVGRPVDAAYETDGAINLPCPTCHATPGEYCETPRGVAKIPHTQRLGQAWITNNPKGKQQHQRRQQHLAKHRKHFTSSWNA